jgi:hypothetical protein
LKELIEKNSLEQDSLELKAAKYVLIELADGLKKEIGLLINFSPNGAEIKRKYKSNNTGT